MVVHIKLLRRSRAHLLRRMSGTEQTKNRSDDKGAVGKSNACENRYVNGSLVGVRVR